MARLKDKVQNALDEARLLVLGAQVLLGFEYRSVFESGFDVLPSHSKYLKLVGLGLLLVAFALLTWPGAYHRIVAGGEDTEGVHQFTSRVMEIALAPFLIALGFDMFVAAEKVAGATAGVAIGVLASLMAFVCWYGLEVVRRGKHRRIESEAMETEVNKSGRGGTRLSDKIRHVLTETRVVLPGAQALLGFQLVTILMDGFDTLPNVSKYVHLISLCLIAASIILLMTPAAYHRIVENGEESEQFHDFAGRILLAAMAALGLGVCGDLFVVAWKVTESIELAFAAALLMLALSYGLWFGLTCYWRRANERLGLRTNENDSRHPAIDQAIHN
jgi:uncharacterized protein DUF6328